MRPFAETIAAAMQAEWGVTPSARKEIGRITHANERAVRNWFEGKNGPNGEHLVLLIRHSDAVLEAVLKLSGRHQLLAAGSIFGVRERLRELIDIIDEVGVGPEGSAT
jgi:hypothetical protein